MSDATPKPAGATGGTADFRTDSDYDLLEIMTWQQSDPVASREAWAEFYRRHATYLYGVCRRFTRRLGGEASAEDLTAETFKRVYESAAHTFKPGTSKDPDAIGRHVRAWLGTIAQNLARDALRNEGSREGHLAQEHWQDIPDQPAPTDSARAKHLWLTMQNVLTERECDVLRVTFQWYDPQRPNQRLPNDIAAELAARWGTNSENIRQIRKRALRELEAALAPEVAGDPDKGQDAPWD